MAAIFSEVPRFSTAGRGVISVEGPVPIIVPPARDPLDPLTPLDTHTPRWAPVSYDQSVVFVRRHLLKVVFYGICQTVDG